MCTICRSYSSLTPAATCAISLDRDDLNLHLVGTIGCNLAFAQLYTNPLVAVSLILIRRIVITALPAAIFVPVLSFSRVTPIPPTFRINIEDDGAARGSSILSFKYVI
jgi:hypothetical protein